MAGIKVDHPPITFALVDPKTGHPTRAMVEFLHKMWLRTGGNDDNDQFIMQMLAAGVPSSRITPASEQYQHVNPGSPLIYQAKEQADTATAMASRDKPSNGMAERALESSNEAKMLAMTKPHASFDVSKIDKGKVPIGGIIMWSGLITNIPEGWALCDGTNNTPDVTNLFIRGATTDPDIGSTGGSNTSAVTTSSASTGASLSTTEEMVSIGADFLAITSATINDPQHSHTATIDTVPAYYALALIMRIQ